AAEPAAAESTAAEPADPPGPVAPRAAAPVAPPPPPSAEPADQEDDNDPDHERPGEPVRRARGPRGARRRHAGNRDALGLGDVIDEARRRIQQARTEAPGAEGRDDRFTDRLARVAVGDDAFQVVADLDLDLAILLRYEHQQAVVLAFVADPASAV